MGKRKTKPRIPDLCPTCGMGYYDGRWLRRRKGGIVRVPDRRRSFRMKGQARTSIRVYWSQPELPMRYVQCRDPYHNWWWRRPERVAVEPYTGLNRHDPDSTRAKTKAKRQKVAQGKNRR